MTKCVVSNKDGKDIPKALLLLTKPWSTYKDRHKNVVKHMSKICDEDEIQIPSKARILDV